MLFIATFNNISVILWQSVLLVEETEENHQLAASR
jgi:energy-converting hydrogenase Eha subunit E